MRAFILVLGILLAAPSFSMAQPVTGAGSTFAQPLLQRWGQIYASLRGEGGDLVSTESGFDYEPVGSTGGIARVLQGAVDFGATDVPMSPEELDRYGLAQFPFVSGGVAVAVNLPGLAVPLRLDAPTLAGIYAGTIARWSDPAIVALNPGARLPDTPIAVIRRSDGSGTTFAFARYLAAGSAEWRDRVGIGTSMNVTTGRGVQGNRDLSEAVRVTPNAIGYVEAGQAARLGLTVALLANPAGGFVGPDARGLGRGAAALSFDHNRHFVRAASDTPDAEAYPIVATVYALMPRRPSSTASSRRALEFFRLGLTERAADATALGYVPLPATTVAAVGAYWRASIRGAR